MWCFCAGDLWLICGGFVVKRGELDGGFPALKNTPTFRKIF
jgi:hypothetical protein